LEEVGSFCFSKEASNLSMSDVVVKPHNDGQVHVNLDRTIGLKTIEKTVLFAPLDQ
jgi:hypothetical protein